MSTISMKAVTALRAYADAMPAAINKLKDSNTKLMTVFQSVREDIGPHDDDIFDALAAVQKFVIDSAEPIEGLKPMMEAKADDIQAYIDSQFGGNP